MPPDSPGSWAARFRRCTSATTWCDEPAEQVGRRQQVWQEVNLQLRLAGAVERWIGWGRFHNRIALASSGSLEHRQHCLAPDDMVAQLHLDLCVGRQVHIRPRAELDEADAITAG